MFSGKPVSVKMLGPEWWHRMIDVCGVGVFRREERRDVFITHTHLDHLLLEEYIKGARLRFFAASEYCSELINKYGGEFEVYEYKDVIKTSHTTFVGRQYVKVNTYGFFWKDAMLVPETDNPELLIAEYAPKFAFIFASYQSHKHPVGFNNARKDVFIVDNRVWRPYSPNVIPKIVFSCSRSDRELYRRYFNGFGVPQKWL
jgi:hypothetical protein